MYYKVIFLLFLFDLKLIFIPFFIFFKHLTKTIDLIQSQLYRPFHLKILVI